MRALPSHPIPGSSAETDGGLVKAPTASASLWLCCYLPRLALEALRIDERNAAAVVQEEQGHLKILLATQEAARRGILPGQTLNSAYAVCPDLLIWHRDPLRERRLLLRLADECQNFTPWVSLDHPRALLLEIGGSVRLFGGAKDLQARVSEWLNGKGYFCRIAVAPTPLASRLLASVGRSDIVLHDEALRSSLGMLPIETMVEDGRLAARLAKCGLRTLRDLWRLPRDGIHRRFGKRLLEKLDQAVGNAPEVLHFHKPPLHFHDRLELIRETGDLEQIMPAVEELSRQLALFLRACEGAVSKFIVGLHHERSDPISIFLELSQATCSERYLVRLLKEKLERTPIQAPVSAVSLYAAKVHLSSRSSGDLFDPRSGKVTGEEWSEMLEVFRARLGRDAVKYFRTLNDHRPEQAMELGGHGPSFPLSDAAPRPLWMLPKTQPAPPGLRFAPGNERIESGWWDGKGVRRDYRVADDDRGVRYWLFRELAAADAWYCHGLFG